MLVRTQPCVPQVLWRTFSPLSPDARRLLCTCSYTPLLPAVATGTIEERSIVEPVRRIMAGKGNYFEASVEKILPDEQVGRGSTGGCLRAGRQGCGASQQAKKHQQYFLICAKAGVSYAGCGGMLPA